MATLTDAIEATKAELLAAAPRIVLTQAQTQLAVVTRRVQNDGLAGTRYSSTAVPTFFFAKRAFNAGGRAYVKKSKKGTYEGFRTALGLYTAAVNLTFTGRMFRSLTTVYGGFSGTVYVAQIVASDRESAAKVGYNMARYGDFLAPTTSEIADIEAVGARELDLIIQRNFPQS